MWTNVHKWLVDTPRAPEYNPRMAHYLVTGGAGFIGSNLCHALVERGERVRVIDNFSTGRMENLAELLDAGKVELVRADLTDVAALAAAVESIDYILHQA